MNPTTEQTAIVDAFKTGGNLVIEAGAGTGKTSTLKLVAASVPTRRGIYVAYNKAIADDAKASFPASVTCATAHSLAYRAVGFQYKQRLNGPRMPAKEAARLLGVSNAHPIGKDLVLMPATIARLAMETVGRFCYSASEQVEEWHVPGVAGMEDWKRELRALITPLARRAWQDIVRPDGRLRFSHDCYLKIWQLTHPTLACDYVLLDEAQDSDPAVADVVARQAQAQQVLVGDRNQAIYGWRGAVDSMTKFEGQRLYLSQSFRFGQAIADEANKWLTVLEAPLRLRGYEQISSTLDTLEAPDAVLCRSNSETVARVFDALRTGKKAALVGGGQDIRRLAEAAITLKAGMGTDHPELFAFKTWGELQEYVEDEAGADLRVFVRLVDSYGPEVIIDAMDHLTDERMADVIISTAHRAKGREWSKVLIADDFREPKSKEGEQAKIQREEAMLAYVSVTRAKNVLDRGGLAWVDQWLDGPPPAQTPTVALPIASPAAPAPAPAPRRPGEPVETFILEGTATALCKQHRMRLYDGICQSCALEGRAA